MLSIYPTVSCAIKSKFSRMSLAASKNLSDDTPASGLKEITAELLVAAVPTKLRSVRWHP